MQLVMWPNKKPGYNNGMDLSQSLVCQLVTVITVQVIPSVEICISLVKPEGRIMFYEDMQ